MVAARLAASRLCLTQDDTIYAVVTINQRPKKDLVIIARSRGIHRTSGLLETEPSGDKWHGFDIAIARFSVHPSEESKNDITTIKMTEEFENGQLQTSILYTSAIKRETGFCPIVFGLCPRLGPDLNKPGKGGKNILLGSMQDAFTFCYGIYVGARKTPFVLPSTHHIRARRIDFSVFSIMFLYTFLTIPAMRQGCFTIVSTTPERGVLHGSSEVECAHWFDKQLIELRNRSIIIVEKTPEAKLIGELARRSVFLPAGTYGNQEFQAWRHSLIRQGIRDPQTIQTRHIPRQR